MKILILTHGFAPDVGGGYRYLDDLVRELRGRDHRVDVLTISPERRRERNEAAEGVIERLPRLATISSARLSLGYPLALARRIGEYDVVHMNFPAPMVEASFALARLLRPRAARVVTYHADVVERKPLARTYNRFVTTPFLRWMDRIIVSSPNLLEGSPHLRRVREKVRVVPFGIDPDDCGATASARRTAGGTLRLLFVGRLAEYKGLPGLVRAMAGAPGELHIVGSGELREGLETLAAELGVSDRIRFHGRVTGERLCEEYRLADVLVLPSIDAGETFGYVLIEAGAQGAALISTELGTGTSYANAHGETGFVVPPRDVAALAQAIRALDEDRELLARFQQASEQRVRARFTLERMVEETLRVYDEAGKERGP